MQESFYKTTGWVVFEINFVLHLVLWHFVYSGIIQYDSCVRCNTYCRIVAKYYSGKQDS